jgi:hypothetical protein
MNGTGSSLKRERRRGDHPTRHDRGWRERDEVRTGKEIEFQDAEACKQYKTPKECDSTTK